MTRKCFNSIAIKFCTRIMLSPLHPVALLHLPCGLHSVPWYRSHWMAALANRRRRRRCGSSDGFSARGIILFNVKGVREWKKEWMGESSCIGMKEGKKMTMIRMMMLMERHICGRMVLLLFCFCYFFPCRKLHRISSVNWADIIFCLHLTQLARKALSITRHYLPVTTCLYPRKQKKRRMAIRK